MLRILEPRITDMLEMRSLWSKASRRREQRRCERIHEEMENLWWPGAVARLLLDEVAGQMRDDWYRGSCCLWSGKCINLEHVYKLSVGRSTASCSP